MDISLFGRLADIYGHRQLTLATRPETGTRLREAVSTDAPQLAELMNSRGTRLVVNDAIVDWDTQLAAQDNIAIIPIVSGG